VVAAPDAAERGRARRLLRRIASSTPVARSYLRLRRLERVTAAQAAALAGQADALAGQADAIGRLEARNEEWAAEVRQLRKADEPLRIVLPTRKEDLLAADWHALKPPGPARTNGPPYTFNWVLPPMGPASGGTTTLFRTIAFLEGRGHRCRVYFYDARETSSFEQVRSAMAAYPPIAAECFYNAQSMAPCDAVFATNWFSAYPVLGFVSAARKFYYVQDFEPYFEPAGTYSELAANTYRFGFHGVTIGSWLAAKLSREYGMRCDAVDLGVDTSRYALRNLETRYKVLFYARPVTPRRGFELGVLALEAFHTAHPELEIQLVGWDLDRYELPFPHVSHGVLDEEELCALYNECAAGMVLSFTNMSLLPLELLACGCLPVVNDAQHTHLVPYEDQLQYGESSPRGLAAALYAAVVAAAQPGRVEEAARVAAAFDWDRSNRRIEEIVLAELAPSRSA